MRLLYFQEPPIPSNDEDKESIPEAIHQEVIEKDFEVFYCEDAPSISTAHTSAEMGFKEKTLDLLALLTAHVGGFSSIVIVTTLLLTPAAMRTSPTDAADKKRKWGQ